MGPTPSNKITNVLLCSMAKGIGAGRVVDGHRPLAAARATQAKWWQAAGSRSGGSSRDNLCPQERHPLGDGTEGTGFGSRVTCWRRLRDWHKAGVWHRLHRVLLDELGKAGLIDWSRASLDSATVPAKRGVQERSQSSRSTQTRIEAARRHRREGHAACHSAHGCPRA